MNGEIEQYLEGVERRLQDKPARERADILSDLRRHISELLAQHHGDAAAVLAELDDPSAYGPLPPVPAPRSNRGFILALCFFLLNAWAVWHWSATRQNESAQNVVPEQPSTDKHDELSPFRFLGVRQVDLGAERNATLELSFSEAPDIRLIEKFVQIKAGADALSFYVLSDVASSNVLIKTETATRDDLRITVLPGLPVNRGTSLLKDSTTASLRLTETIELQQIRAEASAFEQPEVRLQFSHDVDMASAREFIRIDPAVRVSVDASYLASRIVLHGDFVPGSLYTVRLLPGLRTASGEMLANEIIRRIQIPSRQPALAFATTGQYLSPRGNLQIPLQSVNVKEATIFADAILPQNLVQYITRDNNAVAIWAPADALLTQRGPTITNALGGAANEQISTRISLRDLVADEPHGAYYVTANFEKGSARQLVVVTDLGLSARATKDGLFVWVNSLASAEPVANVEVTLYAANNRELGRGVTSTNGIISFSANPGDDKPYVIMARLGKDLSYLALPQTAITPPDTQSGRAFLSAGYEAFVFTDRGVYRPGEVVHFKALLRDKDVKAPASFPVRFRAVRPDGATFREWPLMLDEWGGAETNFVAEEVLPTGIYTLELRLPVDGVVLGSTTIAIEDFVPPQIRVTATVPDAPVSAREPFNATVEAEHLFGRAAAGLAVNASVQFDAAPFQPDGWKGFSFGDREKKFEPLLVSLGKDRLNDKGSATFRISPSTAWQPAARVRALFGGTVVEGSGRAVSDWRASLIDVYPFYIGLRPTWDGAAHVAKTQRVDVAAVRPDGTPAFTNGALKWALARVNWNTVLQKEANGNYAYKSAETFMPISEGLLMLGDKPQALPLVVETAGAYLLTVSDPASGSSASHRFYAVAPGDEWVNWDRERPDIIEITADRASYAAGDVARLLVKSPIKGNALLTVESDRVLDQRLLQIEETTTEIEIPIRADYSPNVYATLTVLRPAVAESVWSTHRAIGAVSLPVPPTGRALNVRLDAPATNLPQSSLAARIRVTDETGNPVRASINVMAVDEGILMLTGFKTPDPLRFFLSPRKLGTEWFDLYSLLMPALEDEINRGSSHIAGGAGTSLLGRLNPIRTQRFKPVALWNEPVVTDENGEATVNFSVPEFSGELRLMAIANDRQGLGSAERAVKVKRPLVVQPSLPRFLAPNDKASMSVQIFNDTGERQSVTIHTTSEGALAVIPSERAFTLAAGEARVEQIALLAGEEPGLARCTLEVTGGSNRYFEQFELPVRAPWPAQTIAEVGSLAAGERRTYDASADLLPGTMLNRIWVGGEPDIQLGGALDYLVNYPYNCLEQTVSKAFPLIVLPELAERILPDSFGREEAAALIRKQILTILSLQRAGGGFVLWPSKPSVWPWGSVYATHVLIEAERAGYEVPVEQRRAALGYLQQLLDRTPPTNVNSGEWAQDAVIRAYAAHVLASAGQPPIGWIARLAEIFEDLPTSARIHTVSALIQSGDPRRGMELLNKIGDGAGLDTQNLALLLLAWLDADPNASIVPVLVHRLEAVRHNGDWQTTTDNAAALYALGEYAKRVPQQTHAFEGRIEADGATATVASQSVTATNSGPFALVNDGPGTMYYAIQQRGVPKATTPLEGDNGISIRREWTTRDGKEIKNHTMIQGDLAVVKLTVDTKGQWVNDLIIEELLPAGFEIENPALQTADRMAWMNDDKGDWVIHRDIRDDRLLLFSGRLSGTRVYYYTVRAVTPGTFVRPPSVVSGMYAPELRSVWGGGSVTVTK